MKLRDWLTINRYTVKEFSEIIKYDRSYVHTWLSGKKIPSAKAMKRIRTFTSGRVKELNDLTLT